jgi:hypothetical protein
MKAVTAFLVVFALMVFAVAPAAAVERGIAKPGALPQTPEREIIPAESGLPQGEAAPVYPVVRNTELLAPITPGTYTIGAAGTYINLAAAVNALNVEGLDSTVTGSIIFEFIDAAYTDTGVTLGPIAGQSLSRPIIFRPAAGVNARILFTGGTSASWTFGVRLNNVVGVTWDGSNNGTSSRNLTLEADTNVSASADKNVFVVQRASNNVLLKNMVIIGNRRGPSGVLDNSADVVRINNVVTPAATAGQFNITVQNNRIYRGNAGIALLGRDLFVDDANFFFIGNEIGGFGGPYLDNQSSNFFFLRDANNVVLDGNYCYGAVVNGTPIGIRVDRRINGLLATNNRFRDVTTLAPGAGRPMYLLVGNNPTVGPAVKVTARFINNFFFDAHNTGAGASGRAFEGIFYNPTGPPATALGLGSTVELTHNTFAWNPQPGETGVGGTLFMIDGNFFGGNNLPDSLIIKNNVWASDRQDGGFTRSYLLFSEVTPGAFNLIANNNLFHQTDLGAFGQYPQPYPAGASSVSPALSDWQTASGNDLASKQGDPLFISYATNPRISLAVGDVSAADSVGAPGLGVAADFDGEVRDVTRPDAGADEFTVTRFVNDLAGLSVDLPLATDVKPEFVPFSPVATFKNFGSANQAAAGVRFQILDTAAVVVYDQTTTIAILGYDNTTQTTFPPVPGGLVRGLYTTRAIAQLAGDSKASNDTVVSSFNVGVTIASGTFPYTENFEGAATGWLTYTPGGPNDWVLGTPAKTQIAGAKSGTTAWVTKVTGTYSDNQESYVQSPIFNLSAFTGFLKVSFYSNFKTEDDFDGGDLEISLDAGITWSKVDSTLGTGPNFNTAVSTAWYNESVGDGNISVPYWSTSSAGYASASAGYVLSSTVLGGLAGQPDVRFRWHFSADGGVNDEGWAFDDVRVENVPADDIGLAFWGIPGYVGGPVPSEAIQVNQGRKGTIPVKPTEAAVPLGAVTTNAPLNLEAYVQNFGVNTQAAYSVAWDIDGIPETPVANTDVLDFGDVDTLTMTWAVPTVGFHAATAVTQLAGDAVAGNDTSVFNFEVLAPEVVFYEGFNGTSFPPAGWDTLNLDGNVGSVTSWYRSVGFPYEGPASARANFNGANGFFIDEWLITPNTGSLFETSFTVDSLTFWASNFPGSTFPESLMVMVSTSTTDPDSFTLVLGYFEVPASGYTKFTFALPDAAVRYIAFRRLIYDGGPVGTNSDNIFLDDVRITRYAYTNTFTATPGALNFGTLPLGFSANQDVKVKNTGNITLNVTSVTSSNPVFAIAPGAAVVLPGDSVNFTVTFTPTVTGAAAADLIFVHDGDTTPDTVTAAGIGGDEIKFLSITPDTLRAKDPVKLKLLKPVKRAKPGKPILPPNWANLFDETVAQGGFQPGATEGDDAGGMVVGISHMFEAAPTKWKVVKDSAAVRAWVRLTKWNFKKNIGKSFNALQKTMEDKTGIHDLLPVRGFTTTTDGKNKPILKQQTKLVPKKQDSPLFAELVALKFNIAASQLGKTPEGYGDLIFDVNGNFLDEMTLLEVSEMADSMMTYHYLYTQEQFDSLYSAVSAANRAFLGPLDTLTFMVGDSAFPLGKLTLKGQVNLATVPYLKLPTVFTATRLAATTSEVESDEDFDQSDDEEYEELPVAAKLYQNYPNPFNPATTIAFALREASNVTITVYNLLGQQVATLLNNEELEEGINTLQFDAATLSSGVYFYRIEAQGLGDEALKTVETRKMMLLK